MGTDTVRVRWAGNRQMVAWNAGGHSVVMDSPAQYKGEGTGARPLEMFLESLAACTAMDVVSILEKKRQHVTGLEINVNATQREEEFPKIYTRIELEYVVIGYGVKPEAVARSIELSEEKYCSVRGMLGPQVDVVTSYRVVEALAARPAEPETEPSAE